MDETDAVLVERARAGDKEAFGALVMRNHRRVHALAWRMTGNAALADDIAQATFLRAWERLDSLREAGAFRPWLCRLTVRASLDHLRHLPAEAELAEGLASPEPGPEPAALANEQAAMVRRAVLALPAQCRAALVLREYEGLSYREIAQALDIPLGTVMSRLNYARLHLREALAHYLVERPALLEGQ